MLQAWPSEAHVSIRLSVGYHQMEIPRYWRVSHFSEVRQCLVCFNVYKIPCSWEGGGGGGGQVSWSCPAEGRFPHQLTNQPAHPPAWTLMLRRLPVLTDPTRKKGGRGSPLVECVSCQHFVVTPGHVLTLKLKKDTFARAFDFITKTIGCVLRSTIWFGICFLAKHTHTHTQYDLPPKGCMLPCTAKYPPIMCLVMHTATALLSVNVCMACTVH